MKIFRSSHALLLVVAFSSAAFAQAKPQTATEAVKTGTAIITGKVTTGDKPAADILIGLIPGDFSGGQRNIIARAKTDASGQFRLERIPAGRYRVTPLAPGFVLDDAGPFEQGKTVTVADGETVSNADFKIERGGVITGKITDPNGRPLISEAIQLERLDERGQRQPVQAWDFMSRQTDDRGIYRIYGLESGRYVISTSSRNSGGNRRFKRTWFPDATDEAQAKVVEVSAEQVIENLDIRIAEESESYSIAGRVIDTDLGRPIGGVMLMVGAIRGNNLPIGFNGGMEATNANGEFVIQGLTAGRYSLIPRSGLGMYVGAPEAAKEYYGDPVEVEIISSDVANVELKMQRGLSLSGNVVVDGVKDPAILARLKQGVVNLFPLMPPSGQNRIPFSPGMSQVSETGSFQINGIRPGKYQISFNLRSGNNIFTLLRIERDGAPLAGEIDVNAAEPITNLRLVVGYGNATVRGVINLVGELPQGFRLLVSARPKSSTQPNTFGRSGEVGVGGRFQIENLMAGEYELMVRLVPTRPGLQPIGRPIEARQSITVTGGQINEAPPMVFDLTKPPEVPNKPKENNQ